MSSSHKCNPLCCIMFLFTFQESGVVRGVLIHWLMLFILTTSLSVSLCPSYLFSTLLLLYLNQTPSIPLSPSLLTHFLLSKEEELEYLTPPVWASRLPIFLPVDHQPARVVMEGEIRRSASPQQPLFFSPSQQHAWCCTVQTEEERMSLSTILLLLSVPPGRRDTTQEQLFSRNASMNAKHVTVFTTLHLPFFLLFSTRKNNFSVAQNYCDFLFTALFSSCFSFFSLVFFEHLEQRTPPSL